MIAFAIRDIIVADSGVTDQLAKYEFDTGVETPAVFTFDQEDGVIPEDSELPAVIIHEVGGVNFGTRGAKGFNTTARVRVYGNRDRGSVLKIAHDLFFLLDRAALVSSGLDIYGVFAEPPQILDDPDGFPGYLVNVSAFVSEPQ